MRWLVLLALLVAACSGACGASVRATPEVAKDDRALIAELRARTVKIDVLCSNGKGWGTGVVLETTGQVALIATAKHVAEAEGCSLEVSGTVPAKVVSDPGHDLSLLLVDSALSLPDLAISPDPYLGMPVIHVGYPRQLLSNESALQVSRGHLITEDGGLQRVSASFYFGSSGGPVFDEQGRLVGIAVSLLQFLELPVDDQYFIEPASRVGALWNSL